MGDTQPIGVRWISWPPGDGYGDAAAQYVRALDELGVPVTWTPLTWPPGAPRAIPAYQYRGELEEFAHRPIEHDTVVVHFPVDRGRDWVAETDGRRTMAYTTWETDRIPPEWDRHCEEFDAVLVPSTFNLDALVASGCQADAHVVSHCARRIERPEPASFDRIGDRFVFYTIGTWSTRKAVGETVTAFLDAFDKDDDVALVVKTSDRNQQAIARVRRALPLEGPAGLELSSWPAMAALLAGRHSVPEVRFISGQVPSRDIDALHARGNCFVSLARSEGYGLCIADALLFGNPVVVTGWGGHLEYLGADYPMLVDYDLISTSDDVRDDWFLTREGYHWAKARHEHAVELLRWVAEHRDEAAAVARRVGAELARDAAPDVVGRRLLRSLALP
jgi:glycosyltransferase involved in cell wall biosynthesis